MEESEIAKKAREVMFAPDDNDAVNLYLNFFLQKTIWIWDFFSDVCNKSNQGSNQ